jgi:hypothetical protein
VARTLFRLAVIYGFALALLNRAAEALVQAWPVALAGGVAGGLAFAALGWATLRA